MAWISMWRTLCLFLISMETRSKKRRRQHLQKSSSRKSWYISALLPYHVGKAPILLLKYSFNSATIYSLLGSSASCLAWFLFKERQTFIGIEYAEHEREDRYGMILDNNTWGETTVIQVMALIPHWVIVHLSVIV